VAERPLTRVKRLARELERQQAQADRTREQLHEAIIEAHEAGEDLDLLVYSSGYTRQRVWQIVKAAREDRS
jgi:hypothetical protein